MHRFPSRDIRTKPKSASSPVQPTRSRASSTLTLLQPSQLHARASSVVRKVLGPRSPHKDKAVFVDPVARASCDKTQPSADLIGPDPLTRPCRNATTASPTGIPLEPKPLTAAAVINATCPAVPGASGSTFQLHLPLDSLLFSPNSPNSDDHDHDQRQEQEYMTSTIPTIERPSVAQGSPEMYDSGYASGHSSQAGSAPTAINSSPVAAKTPRTLGRSVPMPTTPGSMRLSPSVTRPMMPMPILNLPPLPPTPTHTHTLPRTRSFQPGEMRHVKKAMPALMRHGTSNMHMEQQEEDDEEDGDDGSTDDSDSSDTEDATPAEGSSPETRDSIDESIDESAEQSSSEDTSYFDAREVHTPGPSEQGTVGLSTPRVSQNQALPSETSALGLQITPGPSILGGSSPWTIVDATPGADRNLGRQQVPSRADYFSHPVATVRQALKSPHRTPRVSELLLMASPSRLNVSTPRAAPLSPTPSIAARRARAATILRDANGESPRPGLYHQVSQSMMNLTSPPPDEASLSPFAAARSPLLTPRDGLPPIVATPGTPVAMPTPLMRRNSMPTMLRHPPSYKELYPSVPREEEGREKLPPYSCGIHIEAMMPRKMEFSAPGVLAKDRAWKKQYIVLHGTSLFIYKHDIRKQPIGGKVKGKERYEGVVTEDEVDLNSPTVHLPGHESSNPRPPLRVNAPVRRSSSHTRTSSSATENSSRSSLLSRFHGNSSRATIPTASEASSSDDKGSSTQGTVSVNAASCSTSTRRWSHNQASGSFASSLPHFNAPFSSPNALVRHYTLQGSESGLGSDYYKKRNVIRVRCEGEQFLLQAENVMQVVDWIEALQAGTNVALDLDERPMTKPPPFPRRRRRRRRPADTSAAPGASGSGATASSANNASGNNTPNS
ncbi:Nascent polypeptide-associated complex subunit alpha [Ceratobasidium sp. AG-Ba]|nr:Nascent polypeptide-associated complex subunit alpha [Ceratobasidium sp. AG-Ba]